MLIVEFVEGAVVGFLYSFMGVPTQALIVRTNIKNGYMAGVYAALGSTVAQMIYAMVATYIIGTGTDALKGYDSIFLIVGVLLIGKMAYNCFTVEPQEFEKIAAVKNRTLDSWTDSVYLGFMSAIAFPQRILGYVAVFIGLGVHFRPDSMMIRMPVVLGIAIGVMVWFLLFNTMISTTTKNITRDGYVILNRFGGLWLILFGIFMLASAIQ